MPKSFLAIALATLALLCSLPCVLCQEEDECHPGVYDRERCYEDEDNPYLCKGRSQPYYEGGFCLPDSGTMCCCESRDGLFVSVCQDGDTCCDGGCCDPDKSFCCGGGCCDQESEVCCRGQCTGKASKGVTVAVPVTINVILGLMFYCMVIKSSKETRPGRVATFMLLMMIFGALQVLVVLSAWDCSTAVKVIIGIGALEMAVGLFAVVVRMVQARRAGMGVFAAFTVERFVIVAVDTEGNLLGAGVADSRTVQVAKGKLGGKNRYGNVPRVRA